MTEIPPGLEEACEEIVFLQNEVNRLHVRVVQSDALVAKHRQAIDDLNVQCKFWRQAAEHAVTGWDRLEEQHEELVARVLTLLQSEPGDVDGEAWRKLEAFVSPQFRIVEDEKPL